MRSEFSLLIGSVDLDGRLLSIVDGKPFQYNVYADAAANQQRYHQIGKLVEKYIYQVLGELCGLQRYPIPVSRKFISIEKFEKFCSKDRRAIERATRFHLCQ